MDIDAELEKIDDKSSSEKGGVKNVLKKPAVPQIPVTVNTSGLTQQEKQQKAEREKNKGNEVRHGLKFLLPDLKTFYGGIHEHDCFISNLVANFIECGRF